VPIEGSYFCPHMPDAGCECRKPATAMLLRAEAELGADLSESWVIGDADSDVELASRAGCRAVQVGSGLEFEEAARRILTQAQ
jgi:D-glycero-D-manno-heptose 1,7-bisphosphate phosphatase